MPQIRPLDINAEGVFDLMRDYEALRTWELVRTARAAITVAEIAETREMPPQQVHRHLDRLTAHGLLERVRARKPRKSTGYRVTVERIVFTFDDADPKAIERAKQSSDQVVREFTRCIAHHASPQFHAAVGFRFRTHCMKHFTQQDLAELRRLMLPVVEFLSTPRPAPPRSNRAAAKEVGRTAYCNQAVSILLEPLTGNLLPLPDVWMTPRSKLAAAPSAAADASGVPQLAPREQEVALALAEGLTRAHVAERMGLSVHTVSTLARRAYRKLGVRSQAALAARLARHGHRKLGER